MSEGELVFIIGELVASLILIAAVWLWTARAFRRFRAKLDCCEPGELEIGIAERSEPAELPGPRKLSPDGNDDNPARPPEFGRLNALGAKIDELTARIDALTTFIEREHANVGPEHAKRRRRATLTVVRGRKRASSPES